jgi:hypothetical protein
MNPYLQMTDTELLFAYISERDSDEINVPLWVEHNKRFISDGNYSSKFVRLLTKEDFFISNP